MREAQEELAAIAAERTVQAHMPVRDLLKAWTTPGVEPVREPRRRHPTPCPGPPPLGRSGPASRAQRPAPRPASRSPPPPSTRRAQASHAAAGLAGDNDRQWPGSHRRGAVVVNGTATGTRPAGSRNARPRRRQTTPARPMASTSYKAWCTWSRSSTACCRSTTVDGVHHCCPRAYRRPTHFRQFAGLLQHDPHGDAEQLPASGPKHDQAVITFTTNTGAVTHEPYRFTIVPGPAPC